MAGIFVSYRRDDSQGFAGRLADDLDEILGSDRVFRDLEIPAGSDFTDVLHRAIAASDILLVVIGRHWAANSEQGFGSRLFEPTDWVRTEIEAAFSQGKQIVPILVGGAGMPGSGSMPKSIEKLTRLQAATLTDRHWDTDVAELAKRLQTMCPSLVQDQPLPMVASESPAEVLRELGDRFLDEVVPRRQPQIEHPPPNFGQRLMLQLGRRLYGLVKIAIVLGMIYASIRLFGDEALLRSLDTLEARLQIGWERLLNYIEGL
jgi:hypothetical protein